MKHEPPCNSNCNHPERQSQRRFSWALVPALLHLPRGIPAGGHTSILTPGTPYPPVFLWWPISSLVVWTRFLCCLCQFPHFNHTLFTVLAKLLPETRDPKAVGFQPRVSFGTSLLPRQGMSQQGHTSQAHCSLSICLSRPMDWFSTLASTTSCPHPV